MRAVRMHDFGGAEVLGVEELAPPEPGLGEVLVSVASIGVNPVDWKIRAGHLREKVKLPMTPGQDIAGVVAALGPKAADKAGERERLFHPGERVFGIADGAYAELAVARADRLAHVPDALGLDVAAALPTPGLTALQMIERAGVRGGERVLVHGAGGSVGALIVQMAKDLGAEVVATVLTSDVDYVSGLGADVVVDTSRDPFQDRAGDINAVLDLIGGELQQRSWALLRPGGVLVSSVGLAGGPEQEAAERRGIRAASFWMQPDAHGLERLADMVARGQLRVRIGRVLPFPQAREAQLALERHEVQGKVLMRVA
ncbi:MAG: NADP-dependent oxidoreductase [Terriglobales bacterium]